MSNEDKFKVSAAIPDWFNEVICGVMLSNGTIRMHGKYALFNIQQTHEELTQNLWQMCHSLNLILSDIHIIHRDNRKLVYSFQNSYFTLFY